MDGRGRHEANELAKAIHETAPKLQELYFREGDKFSDEVVAAFKELTGNKYNS